MRGALSSLVEELGINTRTASELPQAYTLSGTPRTCNVDCVVFRVVLYILKLVFDSELSTAKFWIYYNSGFPPRNARPPSQHGFHAAHTLQLPVPDFITLARKRSRLAVRMITVVIMSLVS